ncbi:ring-opening amidohydrolase [Lichenihabitans sp. Uapishka_5]|uniref:cyanuric acid amidohydrolase n=1 Tax=Lichenihabitans sp. Uapishka_5 TaxID=3037302 RepID=UPI0029E827A3|nr:ring-opening amidohydrolase [Lichenihabitans sp. Uapishka_5]MDX7951915.1 ring-opening amidohydrolase [Lichenihabitans sp. Uapishka_5]
MSRQAFVHRIAMTAPDDVSGLEAAIARGAVDPACVVAVLGKTEGNGCVNDFTRALAARALHDRLGAAPCCVMSGGTEGALSPHFTVFEVRTSDALPVDDALAVGHCRTPALPGQHLGRLAQVDAVAAGVRTAMEEAGITSPDDVHFVQVKCPLLTSARLAALDREGVAPATRDTLKSMGLSRAASSLGVAVALGEVVRDDLTDEAIGRDWELRSSRASASAGVELMGHEIVVLGRGRGWSGPLRVDHAVMADGIDIEPVRAALARLGLASTGQLDRHQRGRLKALLAKAEPGASGQLRGYRHTMLTDSDVSPTRHARGFTAGALAALVGHAEIYVSGGAEHQGPDGGGPVCVIVEAA